MTDLGFSETLISILANVLGLVHFLNTQKHSIDQNSSESSSCFWQKLPWKNTKRMELTIRRQLSYIGTCFSPTSSSQFFWFFIYFPTYQTNSSFKRMNYYFLVLTMSPLICNTIQHNTKHHVYIKIRSTARPTAEMETRVPMQYFITSYFAASNWALKAWISWYYMKCMY